MSFSAQGGIDYVTTSAGHPGLILDTRKLASCEAASLKGARCLPASDLLGPHKRLANFSGLLWLLGTAGLTGTEHLLVTGDQSTNKEFLAGLLYLAGQKKVSVLKPPLKDLPRGEMTPGTSRSKTRENVYLVAMRSDHIVLRSELAAMLQTSSAPVILDGRSEREYWGQDIRGARGGHLPGAQHLPVHSLKLDKNDPAPIHLSAGEYAVAYGHGSYESIVFFARLTAAGVAAKTLLEGWAGWASDGSLPIDSVTYAGQRASLQQAVMKPQPVSKNGLSFIALIILAGIALITAGFFAGRKFSR